jgi:para-nitrobenzyl esterase
MTSARLRLAARAAARRLQGWAFGPELDAPLYRSCVGGPAGPRCGAMQPIVETPLGPVRGLEQDGVLRFLGIPYAAPPLGALRFAPPAAHPGWREPREAVAFGPAPLQPADGLSRTLGLLGDHAQSEDCLTLNVFAPAAPAPHRPVLVWLHGGAFQTGTAAGPAYDGARLAQRGGVVVVTLNYRVGALGFLHTGAPGCANLGLQDQLAALRFVQAAIGAFGGDPAQLTVFGESAGAGSIVCLLAMPGGRGLFRRAIVQSAAPEGQLGAEEAAERARLLLEKLGGGRADLAWLRSLPAEQILAAQAACAEPGPRRIGMFFAPIVDGEILPESPLTAIARGVAGEVELIIGTTRDEMRLFTLLPGFGEFPDAALPRLVAARLPGPAATALERAEALLGHYAGSGAERFFALETDASLFVPSTRVAEAQSRHQPRTFMYRFSWRSPLEGGRLGACHALDVPFALGTFALPTLRDFAGAGPEAERLAHAVMDAWVAFARRGDPSHAGIPAWPPYAPPRRATLELGATCRVLDAPDEARRRAFTEGAA